MESKIITLTCTKTRCAENIEAIQRVRDLHNEVVEPRKDIFGGTYTLRYCDGCESSYPCPTILALDGRYEQ